MIYSEAEKLAREILADAPTEFGGLTTRGRVQALCNAVLFSDMKREIENAAYKNVIKLVEEGPYGGDGLEIADAISALIQPPAQREGKQR